MNYINLNFIYKTFLNTHYPQLPYIPNSHEKSLMVKLKDSFKSHTIQIFKTTLPHPSEEDSIYEKSYFISPSFQNAFQEIQNKENGGRVDGDSLNDSQSINLYYTTLQHVHHSSNQYNQNEISLNSVIFYQEIGETLEKKHVTNPFYKAMTSESASKRLGGAFRKDDLKDNNSEGTTNMHPYFSAMMLVFLFVLLLLASSYNLFRVVFSDSLQDDRCLPARHPSHATFNRFKRFCNNFHANNINHKRQRASNADKSDAKKERFNLKYMNKSQQNNRTNVDYTKHSFFKKNSNTRNPTRLQEDSVESLSETQFSKFKKLSAWKRKRVYSMRVYLFQNFITSLLFTFVFSLIFFESTNHSELRSFRYHLTLINQHTSFKHSNEDFVWKSQVSTHTKTHMRKDTKRQTVKQTLRNIEACEYYVSELVEVVFKGIRQSFNHLDSHFGKEVSKGNSGNNDGAFISVHEHNKLYDGSNIKSDVKDNLEKSNMNDENVDNINGDNRYDNFIRQVNDEKAFDKSMDHVSNDLNAREQKMRNDTSEEDDKLSHVNLDSIKKQKFKNIKMNTINGKIDHHFDFNINYKAIFLLKNIKKYSLSVKRNAHFNYEKLLLSFYRYFERFILSLLKRLISNKWLVTGISTERLKDLLTPSKIVEYALKHNEDMEDIRKYYKTERKNRKKENNDVHGKEIESEKYVSRNNYLKNEDYDLIHLNGIIKKYGTTKVNKDTNNDNYFEHILNNQNQLHHNIIEKEFIKKSNHTLNGKFNFVMNEENNSLYNSKFFEAEEIGEKIKFFQDDILIRFNYFILK